MNIPDKHNHPVPRRKNSIITIPFLMVCLILTLSLLSACGMPELFDENARFSDFTSACFKEYVSSDSTRLHFTLEDPSSCGIAEDEPSFSDISRKGQEDRISRAQETLKELRAFEPEKLTDENKLTYDIFERKLSQVIKGGDFPYYETHLGAIGLPAQVSVSLSEYAFRDEDDVKHYLALLGRLPDYFEEMIRYEKERNEAGIYCPQAVIDNTVLQIDLFLEREEEDQPLLSTFEERIAKVKDLPDDKKSEYIGKNRLLYRQVIIPAYEGLRDRLKRWGTPADIQGGLCRYDKGREYYSFLLKSEVGTDKSPDECIRLIELKLDEILAEIAELNASREDLYSDYLLSEPLLTDSEEILQKLQTDMEDDFPELPDQDETKGIIYHLEPMPAALSSAGSSAFYLVPPIDAADRHVIYINQDRLNEKDLFPALAHEGYPGHMYQTSYYQAKNPDPLRYFLKTEGYDEGWGTYAQQYSYDHMEFKDVDEETGTALKKLFRANSMLSLTLASLCDLYVNYKDYDQERLAEFLSRYGMDKDASLSSYEYAVENPTKALSYCVGYYELEELKEVMRTQEGDSFELMDFHRKVLDCGSCPYDILRKNMPSRHEPGRHDNHIPNHI